MRSHTGGDPGHDAADAKIDPTEMSILPRQDNQRHAKSDQKYGQIRHAHVDEVLRAEEARSADFHHSISTKILPATEISLV